MKGTRWVATAAAVGAGLVGIGRPEAAAAQAWRDQITRQISNSTIIASARRDGYGEAAGPFYDLVASGTRRSVRVPLEGGRAYRFVGKCDNDCSDLDFRLYDENDNLVASDVETDDVPLVNVTPRRSGSFRLEVAMASCSTQLCGWGVVVMGAGMGGGANSVNNVTEASAASGGANTIMPLANSASSGSSTAWRDQITRQLNTSTIISNARRDGYAESHSTFYDLVPSGARRSTSIRLEAGRTYKLVGKCDNDCSDLDFRLYDENDNLVASDVETDDVPIVNVTPRRSATFRLEVAMASCSTRQCGWGVSVLAR